MNSDETMLGRLDGLKRHEAATPGPQLQQAPIVAKVAIALIVTSTIACFGGYALGLKSVNGIVLTEEKLEWLTLQVSQHHNTTPRAAKTFLMENLSK